MSLTITMRDGGKWRIIIKEEVWEFENYETMKKELEDLCVSKQIYGGVVKNDNY